MSDTPNTTPSATVTATTSLLPKRKRRRGWLWSGLAVLLALIVVVVADLSGVINVVKPPQWLHIPLPSTNKAAPHGQQATTHGSLLWKLRLLPVGASTASGVSYDYQVVQNIAYVEANFAHSGVISAVNLVTGKPLWNDNLAVDIAFEAPQIIGDVMYAHDNPTQDEESGAGSTTVYAIKLSDGSVKWKVSIPGGDASYAIGGGVLCFVNST